MAKVADMRTPDERYSDAALVDIYTKKASYHEALAIQLDVMIKKLTKLQKDAILDVEINHLQKQVVIFEDEAVRQREMAKTLGSQL